MGKYLNLVSYFGGKYPHLKWLISKFPKGNYHFVDAMCGSAHVALNGDYPLVTVNDLTDEIINLFEVLRNDYDEFMRLVYFTPFSRGEQKRIIDDGRVGVCVDRVERARRYFCRCQLGYGANGSQNNHYGTGFEWSLQRTNYYRVDNWNNKLDKMAGIVDRLRHFQIDSRDSLELFDDVNRAGSIVYFDPPYLLSLRKSKKRYLHEQEDDFHVKLAEKVKGARCYVAISGYDSPLYAELFTGMYKAVSEIKSANVGKIPTRECLWTNYDTEGINGPVELKLGL